MPTVKEIGSVIEYRWDDGSTSEISVMAASAGDTDNMIRIKEDNETFYLKPEAWPMLKEKIDHLIDNTDLSHEAKNQKGS